MLYVDDPEAAARSLDLVTTEAGANVWLLQPYDEVVFERTRQRQVTAGKSSTDLVVVSSPQTVVDLMTSPGRGPDRPRAAGTAARRLSSALWGATAARVLPVRPCALR